MMRKPIRVKYSTRHWARGKLHYRLVIDLRSDTVTKPSAAMRAAMASAEVGDDVFGEDPTVRELEEEVARITGKAAALFVSSGTMGNQLAIALHTRPGDEVIVGEGAHPAFYESGAAPVLSGVQFAVAGSGGLFDAEAMDAAIKPIAYWCPRTSLVCIENTHNRAGGRVFPQEKIATIADRARARGLALHLDGARLWNASVASGLSIAALAAPFDSVSLCFSKGLGAPAGSALVGTREHVERARRLRKMWGGGMRQVGILAAGALFALRENRERLADDHRNASHLADVLSTVRGFRIEVGGVETNIVNIDTDAAAENIVKGARDGGVLVNATGPNRLRAVTHLDVDRSGVDQAARVLSSLAR